MLYQGSRKRLLGETGSLEPEEHAAGKKRARGGEGKNSASSPASPDMANSTFSVFLLFLLTLIRFTVLLLELPCLNKLELPDINKHMIMCKSRI